MQFNFKECLGQDVLLYADVPCNDKDGNNDGDDGVLNNSEQIFNILHVPSSVTRFSGNQNKLLYFVKVTEKETAHEELADSYGYFITSGGQFLKERYLKMSRSKQISKKKFQILPTPIVFALDEGYETYIDISDDLHLVVQTVKLLIQKADCNMQFIRLLVHGIFDDKRLLSSLKIDRNQSLSIPTLIHQKSF